MDDSDSSLSEHSDKEIQKLAPIFVKAKKATKQAAPPPVVSPPRPKRPPSPPHEDVLADEPDIAFLVMFRSRFSDALSSKLPQYGPQDIERGVVDTLPSQQVEQLLCALLGLVLNRKKPVERGHHGRALEEAILTQKSQWPRKWNGVNPIHGGRSFENMTPQARLNLLSTLALWSLTSSEAIQTTIKEKYKQQRHHDDENQPLSVQPWGVDADKRRYFLIQGLDDAGFRIYREGSRYTRNAHWYSVAGDIDEARALAKKLEEVDASQAARRLAIKITNAIPMFEATEEKRRKRENRQLQRARFTRPEPGFSLYEGRTRGKRMRYTYDDEDDGSMSDATSTRRSARQSARNTPFEAAPTVTASGRQIRQPRTGEYGESLLSAPPISADDLTPGYDDPERAMRNRSSRSGTEDSEQPVRGAGRATRSGGAMNDASNQRKRKHIDTYNGIDDMSDEEDAGPSEDEWDSDRNDNDEKMPDADDRDDDMSEADVESEQEDLEPQSLVVRLKVSPKALANVNRVNHANSLKDGSPTQANPAQEATEAGAPKCESTADAKINKSTSNQPLKQQPNSSPIAPSAYPTPTSSSFLQGEQKDSLVPAQAVAHPAFRAPSSNHLIPNGVSAYAAPRLEDSVGSPEKNLPMYHQAAPNGV
ncbi:hypothetical protein LTR37_007116 [Vermiconidia calcicola]|uniref:Uncharacterized protein n=1 Tax=Vermiconidia calcicola TaxID=1690605 RepID=A0ACC3NEL9_9PEZI|nr:hypothetical protein LTR37_007116 [Vermiconidia calcicola]